MMCTELNGILLQNERFWRLNEIVGERTIIDELTIVDERTVVERNVTVRTIVNERTKCSRNNVHVYLIELNTLLYLPMIYTYVI